MILDVNVLLGSWAFRRLPHGGHAAAVQEGLERAGITGAVAASLDAVLYRNPEEGNVALYRALERRRDFFTPAATLDPTYAGWERDLEHARREGCWAVRTYPQYQGWRLEESRVAEFFRASAEHRLPVMLTAEIEDPRQRHPIDRPDDWLGGELRNLIEREPGLSVVVAGARAQRVREVALTLGEADRQRVYFDTSALRGPFVEALKQCVEQVGAGRFVFGSQAGLKTPETAVWRVRHSALSDAEREAIWSRNFLDLVAGRGRP